MIAVALLFVLATAQALPAPQVSFTYPGRSFQQDSYGQYINSEVSHTGARMVDQGVLKVAADGTLVLVRNGRFTFTSPEGVPVDIKYTADEYGYHPEGRAIPVPPVPQF